MSILEAEIVNGVEPETLLVVDGRIVLPVLALANVEQIIIRVHRGKHGSDLCPRQVPREEQLCAGLYIVIFEVDRIIESLDDFDPHATGIELHFDKQIAARTLCDPFIVLQALGSEKVLPRDSPSPVKILNLEIFNLEIVRLRIELNSVILLSH
jgi:hypothetical protein